MSGEWGPWIEHDGRGCPCIGHWTQSWLKASIGSKFPNGEKFYLSEGVAGRSPWNWIDSEYGRIQQNGKLAAKTIRYRIRKPRGMKVLETILLEIPNTPEKVSA